MIVVDANLLLYAYDTTSVHHRQAKCWWEAQLSAEVPVGLPWLTILAFLRISTNRAILQNPLSADKAFAIVRQWLDVPVVEPLSPGPDHLRFFQEVVADGQALGPLMMDAHLAAMAIEYGATLHTNDRDFRRFGGLKLVFPLRSDD